MVSSTRHKEVIEYYAQAWHYFSSAYCDYCNSRRALPEASLLRREYPFRYNGRVAFIADIAVEDSLGELVALLEVIDSHPPSGAVSAIQASLGVPLFYVSAREELSEGRILRAYCTVACFRGHPNRQGARLDTGPDVGEVKASLDRLRIKLQQGRSGPFADVFEALRDRIRSLEAENENMDKLIGELRSVINTLMEQPWQRDLRVADVDGQLAVLRRWVGDLYEVLEDVFVAHGPSIDWPDNVLTVTYGARDKPWWKSDTWRDFVA